MVPLRSRAGWGCAWVWGKEEDAVVVGVCAPWGVAAVELSVADSSSASPSASSEGVEADVLAGSRRPRPCPPPCPCIPVLSQLQGAMRVDVD